MNGHCTGGRPPSVGVRPWCDVPAAASNPQPASVRQARARLCAGCLAGGGAARDLDALARRVALVANGSNTVIGHCTGGTPLSFGAKQWCEACQLQPAFAWHVHARHCAAGLLGQGAARELAARARRAALVVVDSGHVKGHCTGGRPLCFVARPWCDVSAAASNANAKPAFAWHVRARHCAGCLSGRGAARELAACARRVALVVIRPGIMTGRCTGEGIPLSLQDRGATCQLQPPTHTQLSRGTCARATALAVSRE